MPWLLKPIPLLEPQIHPQFLLKTLLQQFSHLPWLNHLPRGPQAWLPNRFSAHAPCAVNMTTLPVVPPLRLPVQAKVLHSHPGLHELDRSLCDRISWLITSTSLLQPHWLPAVTEKSQAHSCHCAFALTVPATWDTSSIATWPTPYSCQAFSPASPSQQGSLLNTVACPPTRAPQCPSLLYKVLC